METDYRVLLKKYRREIYNDVVVDGQVVVRGARESKARLKPILDALPRDPVVLDVGCHTGFFTIETARCRKNGVVVGMEGNYMRAELAGAVARANGLENVVILNNLLTGEIVERWGNACEAFSTIYFLNVLHHFEVKDIPYVISGAKRLAPQWILETPARRESSACGSREHRDLLLDLEVDGYEKRLIAETPSHTDESELRPMFLFEAPAWSKEVLRSHYCHSTASKRRHVVSYDLQRRVFIHNRKQEWVPAVNLGTMVALNMVYPTRSQIFAKLEQLIEQHDGPLYDINLWNVLITPNGLKLIDFRSRLEKALDRTEAVDHLKEQFDALKREGAKPLQMQNWINWLKHLAVGVTGKYRRE